jgi:hypothetical protein
LWVLTSSIWKCLIEKSNICLKTVFISFSLTQKAYKYLDFGSILYQNFGRNPNIEWNRNENRNSYRYRNLPITNHSHEIAAFENVWLEKVICLKTFFISLFFWRNKWLQKFTCYTKISFETQILNETETKKKPKLLAKMKLIPKPIPKTSDH